MKISLSWLADYLEFCLPVEQVCNILTDIGLEVEGVEKLESVKGGLEGIVVGEVLECVKHPNADRLSVTKVDLGDGDPVQIVCGAPNVAAGQKVPVATVGTTLYDKEGEPFKIKKGKIRGEVSQGMICAEDELSLGDNHDGIMVLEPSTPVGTAGRDYFEISEDTVIDIALTPNRSDAQGHLGVARDLAAALKINHNHSGLVAVPDVGGWQVSATDHAVEVVVENTEACPRYAGVSIAGVTVAESPQWLKNRLLTIGVRPINNVVDATNFVLHELGQPLHAFDLDQISDRKVLVKTLPTGSKFVSLDEMERSLSDQDLMICDGQSKGMCIGGVFGGLGTGVTDATKNIFLEAAHFDARWIRRTMGRHQLYTDAARTFEKGTDPNGCVYALKRAALLIVELAGGKIASEVVDCYPDPVESAPITVHFAEIDKVAGTSIAPAEVKEILQALHIAIEQEDAEKIVVKVPTDKVDVLREIDVIEEILRIYGFNRIPFPGRLNFAISGRPIKDTAKVKERIADNLAARGFNELMGLSLVRQDYFEEIMPLAESTLVRINNTSNTQIEIMRPNLLITSLETVLHNQNRQQLVLRLFEFGRAYQQVEEGNYTESDHLAITLTEGTSPSWLAQDSLDHSTFFTLKTTVNHVLSQLGIGNFKSIDLQHQHFRFGLQYELGREVLVRFGAVDAGLLRRFDIRGDVYYAEFDWQNLLKVNRVDRIAADPISRFPAVRRDLALVIDGKVAYEGIAATIQKAVKGRLNSVQLFDVYQDDAMLAAGKKSYAISLVFEDHTKTFSDQEIDAQIKRIVKELEAKFGATLR